MNNTVLKKAIVSVIWIVGVAALSGFAPAVASSSAAISSENAGLQPEISTELITKTVDTFKLTDDKRIENKKLPLRFKLVHGNSYPVCKEYVDMLNAAKYMGYPACERKILPDFPKFKELEWKEITDKTEIQRILEERSAIIHASRNKLDTSAHKNSIKGLRRSLNKNQVRLFFSEFDIDDDGSLEVIYRRLYLYPTSKDFNNCYTQYIYLIDDKEITLENAKQYKGKNYDYLTGSDDDSLFIKNGDLYSEYWTGGIGSYFLEVKKVNRKFGAVECKINVI